MRLSLLRGVFAAVCGLLLVSAAVQAGQQVDIYRAQALVKSQAEGERNAAARATFGELMVRVSGQRNALDNPVIRAAIPNAQNYLFGFSYKSSSEKLVEGSRRYTALALQLDYEPQAIGQLLREAQLPLWPAQRPSLLVWLVVKDDQGLRWVSASDDLSPMTRFAAYRGLPLVFPKQDARDQAVLTPEDLWALDQEKILAASARYKADAILIGRYTPTQLGPIPPAVEPGLTDEEALEENSVAAAPARAPQDALEVSEALPAAEPMVGPWLGDWLLLHQEDQQSFADETPEVKGLFQLAIDRAADYFAGHYAIVPTAAGPQSVVLKIGNVTSFAAFKNLQAYLEELALVQRMEVLSVTAQGVLVRLTTDADPRLVNNTLALGRRMTLVAPPDETSLEQPASQDAALPADIDADALADLERALASELALDGGIDADQVTDEDATAVVGDEQTSLARIAAGTTQDPLVYLWQK